MLSFQSLKSMKPTKAEATLTNSSVFVYDGLICMIEVEYPSTDVYQYNNDALTQLQVENWKELRSLFPIALAQSYNSVQIIQTLIISFGYLRVSLGRLIIFMIRKATYFSQARESLLVLLKKSTSTTTDSKEERNEPKLTFYRSFFREAPAISCKINRVQIMPKIGSSRSYAVYCIEVQTNVVHYIIKKRYTQFEKLYYCCLTHKKLNTAFPPRTIFQAGWSEVITAYRMKQLNKFLQEISDGSVCESIKFELYDFLHIYEQYEKQNTESDSEGEMMHTDQFLISQLIKLNQNPANMMDIFQRIKFAISQRKKRLGYQVARQFFSGFQEYAGILSIVIGSENELILLRGLQFLNWLVSSETHRDYQIFRKMLLKCIPNQLIIDIFDQMRSQSELLAEYFKLIKQYLSGRQEGDIQCIAKFYEQGESFEAEYTRWLKYSNLDSRG